MHVKGLELPAHDPRAYFSSAISYATANRGACHLAGLTHGLESVLSVPELGYAQPLERFESRGKGVLAARMQDLMSLFDALKICKFLIYSGVTVDDLRRCLHLVTGRDMDLETFLVCGERIFTLKRLYNVRCGVRAADDRLPARILEPLPEGGTRGQTPDMAVMLEEYYAHRQWNPDGIPSLAKAEQLGLQWAYPNAGTLEKRA